MQLSRIAAVFLLSVIALCSAISLVAADAPTATSGSVWTSDTNDPNNHVSDFIVGEQVYIFWSTAIGSTPGGTVNIEVINADTDVTVYTFAGGPFTMAQQPKIWVPTEPGNYMIILNGQFASRPIAVATVFVAPESIFGALTAIGACFAGFVVFKKRNSLPKIRF